MARHFGKLTYIHTYIHAYTQIEDDDPRHDARAIPSIHTYTYIHTHIHTHTQIEDDDPRHDARAIPRSLFAPPKTSSTRSITNRPGGYSEEPNNNLSRSNSARSIELEGGNFSRTTSAQSVNGTG